MTIRLQSIPSERQSMYEKYSLSGWTKNIDTSARVHAAQRTASDLTKRRTSPTIFFASMASDCRWQNVLDVQMSILNWSLIAFPIVDYVHLFHIGPSVLCKNFARL